MHNEQTLNLENITAEEVHGFTIRRSLHDRNKFNIFAIGKDSELLVCCFTDLTADEAVDLANTLNYPYDQDPMTTELVEVTDGSKKTRFYYAAK